MTAYSVLLIPTWWLAAGVAVLGAVVALLFLWLFASRETKPRKT